MDKPKPPQSPGEPFPEEVADEIIDADDTGILSGERDVVNSEIERALNFDEEKDRDKPS